MFYPNVSLSYILSHFPHFPVAFGRAHTLVAFPRWQPTPENQQITVRRTGHQQELGSPKQQSLQSSSWTRFNSINLVKRWQPWPFRRETLTNINLWQAFLNYSPYFNHRALGIGDPPNSIMLCQRGIGKTGLPHFCACEN